MTKIEAGLAVTSAALYSHNKHMEFNSYFAYWQNQHQMWLLKSILGFSIKKPSVFWTFQWLLSDNLTTQCKTPRIVL